MYSGVVPGDIFFVRSFVLCRPSLGARSKQRSRSMVAAKMFASFFFLCKRLEPFKDIIVEPLRHRRGVEALQFQRRASKTDAEGYLR